MKNEKRIESIITIRDKHENGVVTRSIEENDISPQIPSDKPINHQTYPLQVDKISIIGKNNR